MNNLVNYNITNKPEKSSTFSRKIPNIFFENRSPEEAYFYALIAFEISPITRKYGYSSINCLRKKYKAYQGKYPRFSRVIAILQKLDKDRVIRFRETRQNAYVEPKRKSYLIFTIHNNFERERDYVTIYQWEYEKLMRINENAAGLYMILKKRRDYLSGTVNFNIDKFCQEHRISKRSLYRYLNILKQSSLLHSYISNRNSQNMTVRLLHFGT